MKSVIHINSLSSLLFGCFFTLLLVTGDSYKLAAIPLAMLALLTIPITIKSFKSKYIRASSISLLGYFIVTLLSFLFYGGDASNLDMPSRVVLASCVMALAYTYPPSIRVLMFSICFGAISAGVISVYQYLDTGERALIDNGYMVIQAGGIAAALSVLSIVVFIYTMQHRDKVLQITSIAAIALGFTAVLLSGARGAWLPLPFIVLFLIVHHRKMFSKRAKLYSIIMVSVIVAFSYTSIQSRIESTVSEINNYQHNDARGSSGARLEMWKSALYSGIDKPIFGQGFSGVKEAKKLQVSEGLVDKVVLHYNRAHNQFFEELQTKGLIGVTIILLFFGTPLILLAKKYRNSPKDSNTYYLSLMGIVHILSVIGFSMTQHYLAHHSGIIFYSFGVAIFVGMSFSPNITTKDTD
ncbi:O-antigen ligase family protein [Vibrio fortis]|uniref:O-antigen ligase family protein n=1 Tax=Vibrio fortis TaxID=212667 RepID=UPI0021C367DE|nr:O-antigen ligase family protein [Vibrio fortis]